MITVDQRYWRTPDGALWTRMPPAYDFFAAHLSAWDRVRVIARVTEVPQPLPEVLRADGPGVEFVAVPGYAGPGAFLRHLPQLIASLRQAVGPEDTLLLRGPSNLANVVKLLFPHQASAVEVLGDPWELYAPGAVRSTFRAVYRQWFTRQLRWPRKRSPNATLPGRRSSCSTSISRKPPSAGRARRRRGGTWSAWAGSIIR
ncbi:MAG: hypothetical protein NTV70_23915 [Acidobacteria bacterium]|nr:hypothetical protein [Acidobacteriota bacterium]